MVTMARLIVAVTASLSSFASTLPIDREPRRVQAADTSTQALRTLYEHLNGVVSQATNGPQLADHDVHILGQKHAQPAQRRVPRIRLAQQAHALARALEQRDESSAWASTAQGSAVASALELSRSIAARDAALDLASKVEAAKQKAAEAQSRNHAGGDERGEEEEEGDEEKHAATSLQRVGDTTN